MVTLDHTQALLFVPANRPDRFPKAAAAEPDAIILDLEDAVPAAQKAAARMALTCSFTDRPVIARVNPVGTPWHDDDLAAVRSLQPDAVILPKAENVEDIESVSANLPDLPLLALVETARGIGCAREIAKLPCVTRLVFGSVDYCADLNIAHERSILLPARAELVLASRIAGLSPPIDGVTTNLKDASATVGDAAHARAIGMSGKLCIHPTQIDAVRKAFAPSQEEIFWARRVLSSGDGATLLDGEMVDEPVRAKARVVLHMARISDPSGR